MCNLIINGKKFRVGSRILVTHCFVNVMDAFHGNFYLLLFHWLSRVQDVDVQVEVGQRLY